MIFFFIITIQLYPLEHFCLMLRVSKSANLLRTNAIVFVRITFLTQLFAIQTKPVFLLFEK